MPDRLYRDISNLHDHDGYRVKMHEEFKSDITGLS